MKKTRKHSMLLFIGATLLVLTGCESKMTAEKLVQEVITASQEKEVTAATTEMEFDVNMIAEGVSMDMNMQMVVDSQFSNDPYLSYTDTETIMTVAGQKTTMDAEVYTSVEDGMLKTYTYTDETGSWTAEETEFSDEDLDKLRSNPANLSDFENASFTLEEETQTVDNQEVYVLSCTLTGDMINNVMEQLGTLESMLGTDADIDFSSLSLPITYYISTTTFLPVQVEMSIDGMSDMMNGLMGSLLGDESAVPDMTIDVGTVYVIMNNFSYDPVDVPTLPEDALFAVFLETFNQDLGDGSYVILDGGDAVRITAPDGWTLATLDQTSLSFMKDDGSQIASFNLFYAFTATDLTFSMNTSVLESFKQTGFYSSHGFSTFETANDAAWFQFTDGSSAYYTWFPVGENSFLLVESIDASGLELIEALEPLVELTEAYDLDF